MSNQIENGNRIAIIAGTGFETAFGEPDDRLVISTPYGDSEIFVINSHGQKLLLLSRHGKSHILPPHKINHRANLWALNQLGVRYIMATAATGSLRLDRQPGAVIILHDFIDFRGTATTFFDGEMDIVRHTDFTAPFSTVLRHALVDSIDESNAALGSQTEVYNEGTYLCVSGPRYETPAEVRLFALWGADVVGMTVSPEAILAKELFLQYSAVAVVTNLGTGLSKSILDHNDVGKQMEMSREFLVMLLLRAANKVFDRKDS